MRFARKRLGPGGPRCDGAWENGIKFADQGVRGRTDMSTAAETHDSWAPRNTSPIGSESFHPRDTGPGGPLRGPSAGAPGARPVAREPGQIPPEKKISCDKSGPAVKHLHDTRGTGNGQRQRAPSYLPRDTVPRGPLRGPSAAAPGARPVAREPGQTGGKGSEALFSQTARSISTKFKLWAAQGMFLLALERR